MTFTSMGDGRTERRDGRGGSTARTAGAHRDEDGLGLGDSRDSVVGLVVGDYPQHDHHHTTSDFTSDALPTWDDWKQDWEEDAASEYNQAGQVGKVLVYFY